MKRHLAVVVASLAGAIVVGSAPASAAPPCIDSPAPESVLDALAAKTPVREKTVGAGWDAVVLGTVTEVRHKSPRFRYRITMAVDSTLGAELPAVYTFFGSSRGTYAFELGKAYAVPIARRGKAGPLLPTTELWVDVCDPVVAISDLGGAHEVIARSKPGYVPSASVSATPTPSASDAASAALPPTPTPTPTVARRDPSAAVVDFPPNRSLAVAVRRGIYALVGLALLIALVAAAEHWWSRRHFA